MANPTKYRPTYNFTNFQTSNPRTPLPAQRLDNELFDLTRTTTETIDALAQIRRSDGQLGSGIVTLESLAPDVLGRLGSGSGGGSGGGGIGLPIAISDVTNLRGELDTQRTNLMALDREIDTFSARFGETRDAAVETVLAKRGAQNGLAPLGPDGLLPANIFPEGTGGGSGDLGYTPEDVARKNAANGYAGLDGGGRLLPAQQGFQPDPVGAPAVFVPLGQRLGQEVVLTDGYVTGSNVTDFSDLTANNMLRARDQRRPFVIPADKFVVSRKFAISGVPFSVFGYGMTLSALEWAAGSQSSGLEFNFDDDTDFAHFEDFGLYTKLFNQGTALRASFAGKIRNTANNAGDAVVFSRFQPTGRARGLLIRGTDGTLVNGFNKGIEIDAPLGFNIQECHLWGASNGPDPQYASDTAIYMGKAQGYGHPVECLVQNNRAFRWGTALCFEGMEGCFAQFNNFVGVGIGCAFKDTAGRPHLDFSHNHCNVAKVGVQVDGASQVFIENNLIYHVIGATETGYGVSIGGPSAHVRVCGNEFESAIRSSARFEAVTIFKADHGVIDGNTFRPTVQQPGYTVDMRGITLAADARFFKIGRNNVFEDTRGGRPALITKTVDNGVDNVVPGMGIELRKRSGSQSLASQAEVVVAFGSPEINVGNAVLSGVGTSAFTIPVEGVWTVDYAVQFTGSVGNTNAYLTLNGTDQASTSISAAFDYNASSGGVTIAQGSITRPFSKGDVLRVVAKAGASSQITGGRWTKLALRRQP